MGGRSKPAAPPPAPVEPPKPVVSAAERATAEGKASARRVRRGRGGYGLMDSATSKETLGSGSQLGG